MGEVIQLPSRAADYAVASHGTGTQRAYMTAWRQWCDWCAEQDTHPLQAAEEVYCDWLAARADAGAATGSLRVAAAAVRHGYKLAGVAWIGGYRTQMVMAGIVRSKRGRTKRQASPATAEVIKAMLPHVLSRCHRALLLIGYGAALRRSELMGLDLADVEIEARGVLVTIRHSKTDQEGRGEVRAIARGRVGFDPVEALEAWLAVRGDRPGPLFGAMIGGVPQRYIDQQVSRVVAGAAAAAGLPGNWSSHSLRAGMITDAARLGSSLESIARHARHKRLDTTAGYIRPETAWVGNVTVAVFEAG